MLNHIYPQPDLVIFLDAPPEVLFSRKGETTLDYLQQKRKTFLEQGKKTANFVRIDATQPIDAVFAKVTQTILQFQVSKHPKRIQRDV
jgi:thymidylate kinase